MEDFFSMLTVSLWDLLMYLLLCKPAEEKEDDQQQHLLQMLRKRGPCEDVRPFALTYLCIFSYLKSGIVDSISIRPPGFLSLLF